MFIDYFSRYCKMVPIKDRTSDKIIQELEDIFNQYGVPETLVSDNAKNL